MTLSFTNFNRLPLIGITSFETSFVNANNSESVFRTDSDIAQVFEIALVD